MRELEFKRPDLAIVDLKLPDGSGLELVRRVRAADGVGPARSRAAAADALRLGDRAATASAASSAALDDYVVKPFSYRELRLRIAAVLRRSQARMQRGLLRVGELEIDPAGARRRGCAGSRVELAAKEFALLRTLASSPTRVFTKDELLRDVWGFRARGSTRTLDSHACRLRAEAARRSGDQFVVNVWGVGYRLVDGPIESEAA